MYQHIEGLIAAPFTAFHADGEVNLNLIEKQAESLHRNGVQGVFVCGTTGEGHSLTVAERIEIAQRWVEVAAKDLKIIIHVGHNAIAECKTLASHTQQIGVCGIGVMAPFFFKPQSVAELVTFCQEVAGAAPELPFYYYHIPCMTGVNFPMISFLETAADQIPNLAGIKYTYEDLMDFEQCLRFENGRFDMLFGRDEMLLSALALGTRGAVGSTYNFAAPLYPEMIQAFDAGDWDKARNLQHKAVELIQLLAKVSPAFLPAAKAVMKLLGIDCGPVRPPLSNLTQEQLNTLQEKLQKIGFFEYASK
jgi:N-acetylneuraminate lyase